LKTQRDAFISALFDRAKEDKDICLISVDMGAPSLDRWREELPEQFFAAGISEQNAINFAAGLSAAGKKPYVYFMACWAARCFEQIRYSCAMANNPIVVLGNGIALGYAPAGPAHSATEDIAYMKSLCNIEIFSPTNSLMAEKLVDLTCDDFKLRYIRLERSYPEVLDNTYRQNEMNSDFFKKGMRLLRSTGFEAPLCIISNGYMLGRAIDLYDRLVSEGLEVKVLDVYKTEEINREFFESYAAGSTTFITLEEQTLSGGFGSSICEVLTDINFKFDKVIRFGLPSRYIFENGSREHLLNTNGLSAENIFNRTLELLGD